MDLFEISNLVSVGIASVTDLYSSLGGEREWEGDRVREIRPIRRGEIMLVQYGNSVT